MAFTTVVGGFEIASTVGTYFSIGQNYVKNNKNKNFCQIKASLSNTKDNLLHVLDDLIRFADILNEDESALMKQIYETVSVEFKECRKIPVPKKMKYFKRNPQYTKQLQRVRDLEEASSNLTVTVKETSSDAAMRVAQRRKLEQQDRQAREARRNYLEDVEYYRKLRQVVSGDDSHDNEPVFKEALGQGQALGGQSTHEHAQQPHRQDPFLDEVSTAWAEHKPLRGCA